MPDALSLEYEVNIRTLDQFLSVHPTGEIALLTIDVEGFELSVLNGCNNQIRDIQNIVFEALPDSDFEQVVGWLSSREYFVRTVGQEPWRSGVDIPEDN